jgi:hypothetical protein
MSPRYGGKPKAPAAISSLSRTGDAAMIVYGMSGVGGEEAVRG